MPRFLTIYKTYKYWQNAICPATGITATTRFDKMHSLLQSINLYNIKMSDKIDILVHQYAREYSATGDKYYSSAEQFSQYLDKIGVKSPIEIWHKYVLPDNMNPTDFFNLLRRLDFLTNHEKLGMPVPLNSQSLCNGMAIQGTIRTRSWNKTNM